MTSLSPSVAPDRFTWSRVWSIMRLISPRVRNFSIFYVVASLVVVLLCVLAHLAGIPVGSISIIVLIPAFLFYAAPAFVVNATDSLQFQQIPATISEKFVAISIYALVINLLVYSIPSVVATVIALDSADINNVLITKQLTKFSLYGGYTVVLNWLSSLLAPIVCMYVAIANPGHKWKAVGAALLVCLGEGFAGGAYGIFMTFRSLASSGVEPDVDALILDIVAGMAPFMYVMMAVCVVLEVLFMVLAYRKLASRQI